MTKLLEKVLNEVSRLPEKEQDALAAVLLSELESEQRWSDAFAKSQGALLRQAQEARAELQAGKTKPFED
jgi:hypothetical protein